MSDDIQTVSMSFGVLPDKEVFLKHYVHVQGGLDKPYQISTRDKGLVEEFRGLTGYIDAHLEAIELESYVVNGRMHINIANGHSLYVFVRRVVEKFESGELELDDDGDGIVSFTSDILDTLHLEWV